MARSGTSRGGRGASAQAPPPQRQVPVGRPLQARLIALEKRIGLFSEEQSFAADSRFNHPVILPAESVPPAGMAVVFAEDFAALQRMGKPAERCHCAEMGPYRVYCVAYFHYDGFRALLYVEREGAWIGAWREAEVLQPDSPRMFIAGTGDAEIQAFLEQIPGV